VAGSPIPHQSTTENQKGKRKSVATGDYFLGEAWLVKAIIRANSQCGRGSWLAAVAMAPMAAHNRSGLVSEHDIEFMAIPGAVEL
jgi:hypothetical protein